MSGTPTTSPFNFLGFKNIGFTVTLLNLLDSIDYYICDHYDNY